MNVDAAQLLTEALRQWQVKADDIASLVIQAETIGDVPSRAVPLLDQIGSDGTSLAGQISRAAQELTSFRLSEFATFQGIGAWRLPEHLRLASVGHYDPLSRGERAQAEAIVQRIADAVADHRVPAADDRRRLRELFDSAIDDESVAAAAHNLVLRGYPLHQAVLMYHKDHIAAVYDHVAGAIESGTSPFASGLPSGLFPVEYRRWHVIERELVAAHGELIETGFSPSQVNEFLESNAPIIAERDALRLQGFAGQTFTITADGTVSAFAAASTTAAWGGPTTSTWFGDGLAPLFDSVGATETVQIGQALSENPAATLAFMNELGAQGVARIPDALARRTSGQSDQSLLDYSVALAAVSGHQGLGFTGAQLIEADLGDRSELSGSGDRGMFAELLLDVPGYAPAFVLDSAATSLRLRGADYNNWSGWRTMSATEPDDPRMAAVQSVLTNGLAAGFISHLAGTKQLGDLIEPELTFHADADHSPTSLLVQVIEHAGVVPDAANALVEYLYERGSYQTWPLTAPATGMLANAVRESREITDERVLTGLSAMLAVAAPGYVGGSIPADEYIEAQLSSPYFGAYHTVLISGSGGHVLQATSDLITQHIYDQLTAGARQLDLGPLERFAGTAAALAQETNSQSAELIDEAASNLARNLSVVGLLAGPLSAAVSTSAGLASLATGSDNTALGVAEQQFDDLLNRGFALRVLGIAAIFGSGRVRTPSGHKVELEVGERQGRLSFRLHLHTSDPGPKRGAQVPTYYFDELEGSYAQSEPFADLTMIKTPLVELIAEIEGLDTQIDQTQTEASKRIIHD